MDSIDLKRNLRIMGYMIILLFIIFPVTVLYFCCQVIVENFPIIKSDILKMKSGTTLTKIYNDHKK